MTDRTPHPSVTAIPHGCSLHVPAAIAQTSLTDPVTWGDLRALMAYADHLSDDHEIHWSDDETAIVFTSPAEPED